MIRELLAKIVYWGKLSGIKILLPRKCPLLNTTTEKFIHLKNGHWEPTLCQALCLEEKDRQGPWPHGEETKMTKYENQDKHKSAVICTMIKLKP